MIKGGPGPMAPAQPRARGRPRVLLTDPIAASEAERLGAVASVRSLQEEARDLDFAVSEAEIVIVRRAISAESIRAAPRLRALVRHGAGLDFIPIDVASQCGVAVVNTPAVNAPTVAEAVFALLLAGARRIPHLDRAVREERWHEARADAVRDRDLGGTTLGVVGFGAVGAEVARIGHFGFGMRVVAVRRGNDPAPEYVELSSFENVLSEADHLVIAVPLSAQTRGMIDATALRRMRSGASLVNVARGAIVDQEALMNALSSGKLRFAALDVLAEQPPTGSDRLFELPNLILTPHVAGVSADSMLRMSRLAVEASLEVIAGRRPRHLVNVLVWDAIAERWSKLDQDDYWN